MVIVPEIAVSDVLPLVLTVAVIVAVVVVIVVVDKGNEITPLELMVEPEGSVQLTKLAGILNPVSVPTIAVTVPGGVTVVGNTLFRLIVVNVLVVTSIGITWLCPPEVAVTVT